MQTATLDRSARHAARQALRSVLTVGLRPQPPMPVDVWAERHRTLPGKGRYNLGVTPYLRRPLQLYGVAGVNWIVLMFASQLGKTEFTDTCKLYTIDRDPASTVVMFANIEAAREYNQDRFLPALQACPTAMAQLSGKVRDIKTLKLTLRRMTMWFVGSNSKQGRRGKVASRVFCDEVEAYEDPEWVEVTQRVKGGADDFKIILTSTSENEGGPIHTYYEDGSKERYWVPCPHCNKYQVLEFKGLTWDGGSTASKDRAQSTAHYKCHAIGCGKRILNEQKPWMLNRGVWVPPTRTVEDVLANGEGSIAGTGKGNHTGIEASATSFHLSSLYSPFEAASFGKMAFEYAQSKYRMTPKFVRGWLGEPWKTNIGEGVEKHQLQRLCITADRGGYRIGEVPDGVLAITRAIDVQKDRIYVEDRGWGEHGNQTWLVNFMEIPRALGEALQDVTLPMAYRMARSHELMPIGWEFIDSGHFTDEIYRYVAIERAKGRNVFPVKGQLYSSIMARPHDWSRVDQFGFRLLIVNSDYWKTAAAARIKSARDPIDPTDTEPMGFYLPENLDGHLDDYMQQVTAEHRVEDRGKQGNRFVSYKWALKHGQSDNHAFDCLVYNLCGADAAGVRGLTAKIVVKQKTVPERKGRPGWVSRARGR